LQINYSPIEMQKFFCLLFIGFLFACSPTRKFEDGSRKWETEIQQLEKKNKETVYNDNSILLVGSSSIKFWNTISDDLYPYSPIQRGFGGSNFQDVLVYTKRLVYPHKFKALLVFVGNDIIGGKNDKTPREVLGLFKGFEKIVRKKYKKQTIYFIAITPNESRWTVWGKQREANTLIKAYCQSKKNLQFIDTEQIFLNEKGFPIKEYFREDKLHLTRKGYEVWSATIKKKLDETLK